MPDLEVSSRLERVLTQIGSERKRQLLLKAQGRFTYTPDETPLTVGYVMLAEEFGEVGRAILAVTGDVQEAGTLREVREELLHVAAVAVAMIEGIDTGTGSSR